MAAPPSTEVNVCPERVAKLDQLLSRAKRVRGKTSTLKEIRDELGRFHLWCLDWRGEFTVDHMVRHPEAIREGIVELLEGLHDTLIDGERQKQLQWNAYSLAYPLVSVRAIWSEDFLGGRRLVRV